MATAKEVKTDIFACQICFEIVKSPKSLPCLHSFCELCICEYIETLNTKETEQIKHYPCPVCRTVITPTNPEVEVSKWAALLPTNVSLISLMDATRDREKQECHPCKRRRQSSIGIFWCRDCMDSLCQNCSEYHSSIKSLVKHRVTQIENMDARTLSIDLNAISKMCPVHYSKVIEAFCFDHNKLCCVLCLTSGHRKCADVKAIEDISKMSKDEPNSINTIFKIAMSILTEMISEKKKQLGQFDVSVKTTEAKASKMVACAKDKLDRLLLSFSKELSILEDDEKSKLEDDIRVLNQLFENVSHLSKVTALVSDQGSAVQKFIQMENAKLQLLTNILVIIKGINIQKNPEIEFAFDKQLQNIDSLSGLGKLAIASSSVNNRKQLIGDIDQNIFVISEFCGLRPFKINTKIKKVVYLEKRSFVCGVSISDEIVICSNCSDSKLNVVNIVNESIEFECDRRYGCYCRYGKRIVFNKQRNEIYVSDLDGCFKKFLVTSNSHYDRIYFSISHIGYFSISGDFCFSISGDFCSSKIGGIAMFENDIYINVQNTIRKFRVDADVKSVNDMKICFYTNTDYSCIHLNGLAIDPKNRRLIYTSKDKEIICTTLEGKQLFCVKDVKMISNPTSITVHSSGYILVGSETGSVHVISPDNNHYWPLIEKCQKITRLCDIWLDQKEQTLFLCGNEYIEMYEIC